MIIAYIKMASKIGCFNEKCINRSILFSKDLNLTKMIASLFSRIRCSCWVSEQLICFHLKRPTLAPGLKSQRSHWLIIFCCLLQVGQPVSLIDSSRERSIDFFWLKSIKSFTWDDSDAALPCSSHKQKYRTELLVTINLKIIFTSF